MNHMATLPTKTPTSLDHAGTQIIQGTSDIKIPPMTSYLPEMSQDKSPMRAGAHDSVLNQRGKQTPEGNVSTSMVSDKYDKILTRFVTTFLVFADEELFTADHGQGKSIFPKSIASVVPGFAELLELIQWP